MIEVAQYIDSLSDIAWFANVGSPTLIDLTAKFTYCYTWHDAVGVRGTQETANAMLEATNKTTRYLSLYHRIDYRKWNVTASLVRELIEPKILSTAYNKIDTFTDFPSDNECKKLVKAAIAWDISHYLMELAYSDVLKYSLYSNIFNIYRLGRFPCGLVGTDNLSKFQIY